MLDPLPSVPPIHPLVRGLASYWAGRCADLEPSRMLSLLWSIARDGRESGLRAPIDPTAAEADAWLANIAAMEARS